MIRSGKLSAFRAGRERLLVHGLALVVLTSGLVLSASIPAHAAFPGGNGLIAFTRGGRVWVTDTDGNRTKLARGSNPAWSADGTRIAFDRFNRGTFNHHIWTMRADGSQQTRMTSGRGLNTEPAWSPDGSELVFVQSGDLYRIDSSIAAAPFAPLIAITDTEKDEHHPSWSPDGSRIAFDQLTCEAGCGTRIATVAPEGGRLQIVTPLEPDVNDRFPDWSPDSRRLVFDSDRNEVELYFNVYSMSASGDDVRLLTTGGMKNESPAWSPDGAQIAYVHFSRLGRVTVRIGSAKGRSSSYLAPTSTYQGGPDWQPT